MNRRTATYAVAAGIAILVAVVVILNSPVDAIYSGVPPPMLLVTDNGEYKAGVGSYCGQMGPFTSKCVDSTLEGSIPEETAVVPQGSQFEIRMVDYSHPELLTVTLRGADLDIVELELTQISQTEYVADVPKGVYILDFFANWENASMGDASYLYRISVA